MDLPLQPSPQTAPLLVLGWGNLSRGDDALGPACVAALQARLPAHLSPQIEFLDDYQLQIEHALDLVGRHAVLFIDASLSCAAPFEVTTVHARRDTSYSSHALSPFELGQPMSLAAQAHLQAALDRALMWVDASATSRCGM
ncbi:MAG: HoxW protein [Comamonadaceae bacterium]|nr:MAG: HoxW protein [Comamonadaceae bacterium]